MQTPPPLSQIEEAVAEARNDLIAWVWGGAVWSGIMLLYGDLPQAALGGACAFCLRRLLRLFVSF